jgi:ribonuclease P protein component
LRIEEEREGKDLLPKRERIGREKDLEKVLKAKQFHFSSPLLYFVAGLNGRPNCRVAIICRKSIKGAVARNRLKRVLRAAYLKIRHKIKKNIDLLIFPKASKVGFEEACKVLRAGLEKCGLY